MYRTDKLDLLIMFCFHCPPFKQKTKFCFILGMFGAEIFSKVRFNMVGYLKLLTSDVFSRRLTLTKLKFARWNFLEILFWYLNQFVPNAPFLYPLKTSKNRKAFKYFQGEEKGCIGNEWVKRMQWENTRIASVLGKLLQGLLRMKQLSTIGDIVAVMEVEMLS